MLDFIFNKQKNYFKNKLQGVQNMIWDLEFKRFKTREIREEVRQTYDGCKARLLSLENTIKEHKEAKMPEADVARMEDEVTRIKVDIERYEAQLKAIDMEVDGAKPTNDYPEGVTGITQTLDGLRELHGMLKEYISNL